MSSEPTVFQKMQMGALMGSTVGLCIGLVFGSMSIMRYGPGPKGYLGTLGSSMLQSAGMFGCFMSIGAIIRTQGRVAEGEAAERRRWREVDEAWATTSTQRHAFGALVAGRGGRSGLVIAGK